MVKQLINGVASCSGEFVLALVGLLGGLICFALGRCFYYFENVGKDGSAFFSRVN
jgi:hypothetical protein